MVEPYNEMSRKLDAINDKVSQTQICVEELRGDLKVVRAQLAYKADKVDTAGPLTPKQRQALIYTAVALGSIITGVLTARFGL